MWFAAKKSTNSRLRSSPRRGTSTVEFAVCLPLVAALVFGVIEVSNAVFLQNALTSAAYEAANVASQSGGTATNAQSRAQAVLSGLGVTSATVTISPAVTASTPLATEITVTCSAPLTANSLTFGYLGGPTLTAQVVIPRL
ncbi:MAG: TadE/TadG family type IV pilus assembly protein [Planctomycetaceae bacterium]